MRQRDLFNPMCAEVFGRQQDLFPNHRERETGLYCEACDNELVETPTGYLACPRGHGKLRAAAVAEDISDSDLFAEAAEVHREAGDVVIAATYERLAERLRL